MDLVSSGKALSRLEQAVTAGSRTVCTFRKRKFALVQHTYHPEDPELKSYHQNNQIHASEYLNHHKDNAVRNPPIIDLITIPPDSEKQS